MAQYKGTFPDDFKRKDKEKAENGRSDMLELLESSEEIREDLSKALRIISTDLHTAHARFLMEVIQDADDIKYAEGEMPTISITVFPKFVKIECNEEGFSDKNVRALFRTGRNTKIPSREYIGEKGIGFRSFLKLANRAHIRSHPYYFQLDQTRDLGIITPQWDKEFFRDHKQNAQTTIVLDCIRDNTKVFSASLEKELDAVDPVLF